MLHVPLISQLLEYFTLLLGEK